METASRQLFAKVEAAHAIFENASRAGICADVMQALDTELNAVEVRFGLSTSYLHISAVMGETNRIKANAEFVRILASENFPGLIDQLVVKAEKALRSAGAMADCDKHRGRDPSRKPDAHASLQRFFDVYPRGSQCIDLSESAIPRIDYEYCPSCGHEMLVDANRSELRCDECGCIRELVGTVFDDSQFYSQEGQKAKSGTFNPNRHFQFWWTHILAREPEEEIGDKDDPDNAYGEKILETLRRIIDENKKILRILTVNDVREMLRQIDRTDLNKNVPLLMRKLTGVGPPVMPEAIAVRVENLFTKAIETGERVRAEGRVNRNYYPYYIYKILDQLIPEDDPSRRILYYIYIQSKDTVEADDLNWKLICDEVDELVYVPTVRTKALQYAPL